jgi:hypothetical protein
MAQDLLNSPGRALKGRHHRGPSVAQAVPASRAVLSYASAQAVCTGEGNGQSHVDDESSPSQRLERQEANFATPEASMLDAFKRAIAGELELMNVERAAGS